MTKAPAPVVLLWGEDAYLLRIAAQDLLGGARAEELDAAEWRPGATADLATPSLFGEARALLVTNAQALAAEARAELQAYASAPSPDARLLLMATVGARAKGAPAPLVRALGDAAVTRVALDRKEVPRWLMGRAKARGLPAEPPGATALVERLGEDPASLDRALEQLHAAFPEEGLTERTVAEQFRGLGERRIWELCDAAFTRDRGSALRALSSMLAAGEEPLAILGGIASRLRDLLRVRELPERLPPAELARRAGLRFDWQARRFRDQARRFATGELELIHERVVQADAGMKVGAPGDVVLPMLVARIVGA